jgi:phospholipase C
MPVIDHVIVLVLENRSFDHMLGFLDHPDPAFDGLSRGGPYANPGWRGRPAVMARPGAKPVVPRSPDHSHNGVMEQLGVSMERGPWHPTNQGFVASFDRTCDGLARNLYAGLLGPALNFVSAHVGSPAALAPDRGPLVMLSQPPVQVPVLSRLALEFAVCTRWFCSVPGETWPNRNFLHAATSDGETDIELRPYTNKTIFELLEEGGRTWRIYHDDTPQVWAFPRLWDTADRHANWYQFAEFAHHAAAGDLPNYSFIEPNHRPPLHTLDHDAIVGVPDVSNNQHPENNLVTNTSYDSFDATDTDFARGERLIATVYEALRTNPALFERSLLLVTYDEHGGFYDHVPPPGGVPNPGAAPNVVTRLLRALLHRRARAFDFTLLGPRVPAVIISPFVPANTVHTGVHDHASVPATLRRLFAPEARPLNARDAWAAPWHTVLTLTEPRRDDLPDLSAYANPPTSTQTTAMAPESAQPPASTTVPTGGDVPAYYTSFVKLAEHVNQRLTKVGEPEAERALLPGTAAQRAIYVSEMFAQAAERHRREAKTQ